MLVGLVFTFNPPQFDISYDQQDFDYAVSGDEEYYDTILKTADPDLAMGSYDNIIPIGAVCRASGRYKLDHGTIDESTIIPPVSCAARPGKHT